MAKTTIDELAIIVTANSSSLGRDLAQAKRQVFDFAKSVARPVEPPKPFDVTGTRRLYKEIEDGAKKAKESHAHLLGIVAKPFKLAAGAAVVAGTFAAVEAGIGGATSAFGQFRDAVHMAADLEQTKLGFEVMLGDARMASRLVAEVRQFAASTPFNTRELTDSTRQLIAYGRSAGEATADLRMLGDVSAAFGDRLPIGELTYLYGTLFAQQRAFTKDIYQFAGRGIPIYRELAKVTGKSGAELRQMVEDGRIGFEDVRQAFVGMTSAGGQFYGMTARQGKSTAGVIEQMKDAWEMLKIEVGQVIIEEFGIKDMANDLGAFAQRLRENSHEIRPFVRLVGDLAKGIAQITYELGRTALKIGEFGLDSLFRAFPAAQKAADSWRAMIGDWQNFKFDDEKVIRLAADIAESVVDVFDAIDKSMNAVIDQTVGRFKPIIDLARNVNNAPLALLEGVRNAADPTGMLLNPRPDSGLPSREPGAPLNPRTIRPPVVGMSADRARDEWRVLNQAVIDLAAIVDDWRSTARDVIDPRTFNNFVTDLAAARARRLEYVAGFVAPAHVVIDRLNLGHVPAIRGAPGTGTEPPPPPPDAAQMMRLGLRAARDARISEARLRREGEEFEKYKKSILPFQFSSPWHQLAGLGASQHAPPPRTSVEPPEDVKAALFGVPAAIKLPPIPPDVEALRLEMRRRYDPMAELGPIRAQLDQVLTRGLLGDAGPAMVDRFWREKLNEVGGRFGIEHRYQLPSATEVGTAEDARIVTAWQTQGANMVTTESLLQQILFVAQQQLEAARRMPRDIGREIPAPAPVFPWQW